MALVPEAFIPPESCKVEVLRVWLSCYGSKVEIITDMRILPRSRRPRIIGFTNPDSKHAATVADGP